MTARQRWALAVIGLFPAGQVLDGTHGVIKVAYIVGGVAALTLTVRGIERLDHWGRKHDLQIVVPEQAQSTVVRLADRRAS